MAIDSVDPEIERLLRVAIESVERLEILLVMRRDQPKAFTAKVLRGTLSINAAAADTHLAILCGRGFLGVTIGNDLVYTYRPISARIDQHVAEIARLWAERRPDVLTLLNHAPPASAASAFADAFRFRKGGDDDG
jgi:hypothetical protein